MHLSFLSFFVFQNHLGGHAKARPYMPAARETQNFASLQGGRLIIPYPPRCEGRRYIILYPGSNASITQFFTTFAGDYHINYI